MSDILKLTWRKSDFICLYVTIANTGDTNLELNIDLGDHVRLISLTPLMALSQVFWSHKVLKLSLVHIPILLLIRRSTPASPQLDKIGNLASKIFEKFLPAEKTFLWWDLISILSFSSNYRKSRIWYSLTIGGSKESLSNACPCQSAFFHFHTVFSKLFCKIVDCRPPPEVGTPSWENLDPALLTIR